MAGRSYRLGGTESENATSPVDCSTIPELRLRLRIAGRGPKRDLRASSRRDHEHNIKLWFAGKHANWELASYELRQVRASLEDAATHYHGIPIEYVGATVGPILTISAAIEAKDSMRFIKGYNALTASCNACHEGVGRGFIVIQVPTASPFSDQSFAPPKPPQPSSRP